MERHSPITQEVITSIGAEIHDTEEYRNYSVSFLTTEQAVQFARSDYEKKAAVSLDNIFIPYANYDTEYVFPSGSNALLELSGVHNYINSGICYTNHKTDIDSETIFYGNVRDNDCEDYWNGTTNGDDNDDKHQHQRLIGLNKNVYFVGYSEEDEDDTKNQFAGPLTLNWDNRVNMWSALKIVTGYILNRRVLAPSTVGQYREFDIDEEGISGNPRRDTTYTCRNYDRGFSTANANRAYVVASLIPSSSGVLYYQPLYIGCVS